MYVLNFFKECSLRHSAEGVVSNEDWFSPDGWHVQTTEDFTRIENAAVHQAYSLCRWLGLLYNMSEATRRELALYARPEGIRWAGALGFDSRFGIEVYGLSTSEGETLKESGCMKRAEDLLPASFLVRQNNLF